MELNHQAVRAGQDAPFLERFIAAHERFILRAACRYAGHTVTTADDEYSIALLAFYEAVRGYDPASGSFGSFATLVIERRLTDYYRSLRRFGSEVPLAPQVFDGDVDEESADVPLQQAVNERMAAMPAGSTAEEIETANAQFARYGFSFYELEHCAPHTDKTRRACAQAVTTLLRAAPLFAGLQNAHCLPVTALARESGLPKKMIDRYRKYIIAVALLLDGDYPILAGYLKDTLLQGQ